MDCDRRHLEAFTHFINALGLDVTLTALATKVVRHRRLELRLFHEGESANALLVQAIVWPGRSFTQRPSIHERDYADDDPAIIRARPE